MSLHAEKLPIKMWVEAINYTVYTLDKTETSGKKGITIIELWLKKRPNILNLRTFGEKVYFHIPKEKRRKWNVKAEKFFSKAFSSGMMKTQKNCVSGFLKEDN